MSKLIFSLAVVLSVLACKKTDNGPTIATDVEQIIFGVGYAECFGDCSRNFRLTTTQLFADNCDYCPFTNIDFQTTPLADEKFQIAKPLFDALPAMLLNTAEAVYGCPGCSDEGGYYLEITKDGEKHVYQWSAFFDEVPDEVRPYFEKVGQTLGDLQ